MLARFRPDHFTLALVGSVLLASVLPVEGRAAAIFSIATDLAIALLFFLHGARLSRETVIAGATHWRLHLTILACTFVLFPLLGLLVNLTLATWLTPALASGILFLTVLPSTVQSSIAFTSLAGGNVPAAVCAATASNIFGIVLTPLLVGLLFSVKGVGFSFDVLWTIVVQLLLPFLAGQIAAALHRPFRPPPPRAAAAGRSRRHPDGRLPRLLGGRRLRALAPVRHRRARHDGRRRRGPARRRPPGHHLGPRRLGFSREDEITIVFCGSKKSLASGVPMANVIFAGTAIGAIVLPVMLFHQIQLMVCAWLARRYAEQRKRWRVANSE